MECRGESGADELQAVFHVGEDLGEFGLRCEAVVCAYDAEVVAWHGAAHMRGVLVAVALSGERSVVISECRFRGRKLEGGAQ